MLHDIFEQTASRFPDNEFIYYQGTRLSYQQAALRVSQMAAMLHKHGVRAGDTVGIALPRGIDYYLYVLALSKIGAVEASIYVSDRVEFNRRKLVKCHPKCVLTTQALQQQLDAPSLNLYFLVTDGDAYTESLNRQSTSPVKYVESDDNQAAVIAHTSGSSGTPKAMSLDHKGYTYWNKIHTTEDTYAVINENTRYLGFYSFGFDAAKWDLLSVIAKGAALYVADDNIRCNQTELFAFLQKHQINVLSLPTVNVRSFGLKHFTQELFESGKYALKQIQLTGAAYEYDEFVIAALKNEVQVVNLFGPTQIFWGLSGKLVTLNSNDGADLPIGYVYNDTVKSFLLTEDTDGQLRQCADGEEGVLYVESAIVGNYLDDNNNQADFVTVHVAGAPRRLFNLRDRAIQKTITLDSGEAEKVYYYHGRTGSVLKVSGQKVDITHVEKQIRQYPGVREVTVIPVMEGKEAVSLNAFVQTEKDAKVKYTDLQGHLKEKCSVAATPNHFYISDKPLPQKEQGKIDAAKLTQWAANLGRQKVEQPPRTPLEKAVALLWYILTEDDADKIMRLWGKVQSTRHSEADYSDLRLWKGLCGLPDESIAELYQRYDIHQDRFEYIGGDSIRFTKMLNIIQKRFDFPIDCLLQTKSLWGKSIAEIAEEVYVKLCKKQAFVIVKAVSGHADDEVDRLEEGFPPIVFIPGITGDSNSFAALDKNLGLRTKSYAIHDPGLEDPLMNVATLRAKARGFNVAVDKVLAGQAPHFIGWSLGCNTGWEMVMERERRGKPAATFSWVDGRFVSSQRTLHDFEFTSDTIGLIRKLHQHNESILTLPLDASITAYRFDANLDTSKRDEESLRRQHCRTTEVFFDRLIQRYLAADKSAVPQKSTAVNMLTLVKWNRIAVENTPLELPVKPKTVCYQHMTKATMKDLQRDGRRSHQRTSPVKAATVQSVIVFAKPRTDYDGDHFTILQSQFLARDIANHCIYRHLEAKKTDLGNNRGDVSPDTERKREKEKERLTKLQQKYRELERRDEETQRRLAQQDAAIARLSQLVLEQTQRETDTAKSARAARSNTTPGTLFHPDANLSPRDDDTFGDADDDKVVHEREVFTTSHGDDSDHEIDDAKSSRQETLAASESKVRKRSASMASSNRRRAHTDGTTQESTPRTTEAITLVTTSGHTTLFRRPMTPPPSSAANSPKAKTGGGAATEADAGTKQTASEPKASGRGMRTVASVPANMGSFDCIQYAIDKAQKGASGPEDFAACLGRNLQHYGTFSEATQATQAHFSQPPSPVNGPSRHSSQSPDGESNNGREQRKSSASPALEVF